MITLERRHATVVHDVDGVRGFEARSNCEDAIAGRRRDVRLYLEM